MRIRTYRWLVNYFVCFVKILPDNFVGSSDHGQQYSYIHTLQSSKKVMQKYQCINIYIFIHWYFCINLWTIWQKIGNKHFPPPSLQYLWTHVLMYGASSLQINWLNRCIKSGKSIIHQIYINVPISVFIYLWRRVSWSGADIIYTLIMNFSIIKMKTQDFL